MKTSRHINRIYLTKTVWFIFWPITILDVLLLASGCLNMINGNYVMQDCSRKGVNDLMKTTWYEVSIVFKRNVIQWPNYAYRFYLVNNYPPEHLGVLVRLSGWSVDKNIPCTFYSYISLFIIESVCEESSDSIWVAATLTDRWDRWVFFFIKPVFGMSIIPHAYGYIYTCIHSGYALNQ